MPEYIAIGLGEARRPRRWRRTWVVVASSFIVINGTMTATSTFGVSPRFAAIASVFERQVKIAGAGARVRAVVPTMTCPSGRLFRANLLSLS